MNIKYVEVMVRIHLLFELINFWSKLCAGALIPSHIITIMDNAQITKLIAGRRFVIIT